MGPNSVLRLHPSRMARTSLTIHEEKEPSPIVSDSGTTGAFSVKRWPKATLFINLCGFTCVHSQLVKEVCDYTLPRGTDYPVSFIRLHRYFQLLYPTLANHARHSLYINLLEVE